MNESLTLIAQLGMPTSMFLKAPSTFIEGSIDPSSGSLNKLHPNCDHLALRNQSEPSNQSFLLNKPKLITVSSKNSNCSYTLLVKMSDQSLWQVYMEQDCTYICALQTLLTPTFPLVILIASFEVHVCMHMCIANLYLRWNVKFILFTWLALMITHYLSFICVLLLNSQSTY